MNFLENYEPLLKAFWYIALPVSIFFALQTIATFIGLGDSETDADSDGGDGGDMPFELFTLRNLVNFLIGFSWTGISFYNKFEICQIYYHAIDGDFEKYTSVKYQKNENSQPSYLFKDFENENDKAFTRVNINKQKGDNIYDR